MDDKSRRLAAIAALLLAGIFAGSQLGKIAPLVGWYRDTVGFDLVLIGWLTAAIGVFVALLALPAGWVVGAFGSRRSFYWSAAVLAIGGVGLALLQSPAAILAARLVEGLGYLAIVIAVPAILTSVSRPAWRGAVLALWGGFVPVGFAAADFLAAVLVPAAGQRTYLLAIVGCFVVFAVASALFLARVDDETPDHGGEQEGTARPGIAASLSPAVIAASLSFGAYVVLSVGFFAFMPTYVAERGDLLFAAGVFALAVPVGNILASLFMRRGSASMAAWLTVAGFLIAAAAGVSAFVGTGAAVATISALAFAIAGGVAASALFAAIPYIVPKGGSVAVVIGLVAQTGGIGTVFGPPLAAHVIERYGWTGYAWFLAITGIVGALLVVPLLMPRRAR